MSKSLLLIKMILIALLIIGCNRISNSDLKGTWQAVDLMKNNQSLEMDLSKVTLAFDSEGGYNYHGTSDYRESGFYQLDKNFLYTIDTVNQGSSEKAVEIIEYSQKVLFIKMMEKGEERLLKFKKK